MKSIIFFGCFIAFGMAVPQDDVFVKNGVFDTGKRQFSDLFWKFGHATLYFC